MEAPAAGEAKAGISIVAVVFVALFALTLFLVVLSFPLGVYTVFSGKLSQNVTSSTIIRPYFWVGPAVQFAPFVVSAGAWFALFTAVYLACLAFASLQRERLGSAVRGSLSRGAGALTSSPLVVVIVSIGFLTFTASMIDLLVSSAGAPIGGPSGDPFELLLGISFAPLVEEVGFRVLLIGVVALILSLARPWRTALAALWRPSKAIEGFAVGSGASLIIWAATSFSAVTFGACHVVCGGGSWDIGKLPEAVYGGLVLGYLYVRYGLHVSVLAHWGVNYFGSVYAFFGQAAYGIPWNSAAKEYVGQLAVDVDMLFLFGLASFLLVMYLGVKKVVRLRSGEAPRDFDKAPFDGGEVKT